MADTKISALSSGGAIQDADELPVARAGGNVKITGSAIASKAPVQSVAGKTGSVTLIMNDITDITSAGKALLDDADASAQRATLGIGAIGTLSTIAAAITCVFDGSGAAIASGSKVYLEMPFAMTITGWTLIADQSGSIVIDVWKDTYANYPPTVADTITGTEKPTLSSATKNQDLSLSTWTTTVSAGDTLVFNVDSASTVTKATLIIRGTRTS